MARGFAIELTIHNHRVLHGRSACLKSLAASFGLLICLCHSVTAAPPQLYGQPANESPVRADPDDLLLLAGYAFRVDDEVVYRAMANTTEPSAPPTHVPTRSTAETGLAAIVSSSNVPYSLTIKLPQVLRSDQSYALWVRTAQGEWSRPVLINDARPLWISPAFVYASHAVASLPRELKIVGRNLQTSPGASTQIQLAGPQVFNGVATIDATSSATMDRYVARLRLPGYLVPGRYRIRLSRDGVSWIEVPGQTLEVRPDETPAAEFAVSDPQFGGCRPNDASDDTGCILRAIGAAKRAGGGTVYFGPGTWDLVTIDQAGVDAREGIIVPDGVRLRGAGSNLTGIDRHTQWSERGPAAALTLVGHTAVSGFRFRDLQVYQPRDRAGPFFQLGEEFQRVAAAPKSTAVAVVDEVIITENVFDKTFVAVADGGLPINRLFITYNSFGAFHAALELAGNRFNMAYPFRVNDAVIDHNSFKPGSELDVVGKTGTIATEIGAGRRLDFSGNSADGSSTDYLYHADDPKGWRAAFFWNMNNNMEEVLVAQNTATCTGDKIGDGEAFSFDNNANTFAFASLATVERATSASLAVSAPLVTRQNDRDVSVKSYYADHWIQVVSGPGLGQVRKITGYSTDPITHVTTFNVKPDWDVIPVPNRTRIAVGREFWQLYVVDNSVDDRKPLCQKSNRSRHDAGGITLWAQSADSVIEGNHQYDSDGILVQQVYIVPEHPCADCTMQSFFQSFLEIRGNTIEGEYDWDTDCSASGIVTGIAAAPWGDASPPTVSYGVSISHNKISHADAARGGAIAQMDSWSSGPEPHRWPLSDNMLIHHNHIEDIDGKRALPICGSSHPRSGIYFPQPETSWHTVLYGNTCTKVSLPISGSGVDTIRVCPSSSPDSCECPAGVK
jgi:hypothetical protein